uniref:Uncharacterized protein C3orf38 homolog n=1 Tax=Cacopsylla melanoneura TaxID=428564 RepID=A0A8D8LTU6_9HEMI
MLSAYDKTVLLELLSGVNEHDLIQIAKTVSQKLLNIDNRSQAIDAILLHSQTVESVLHRKKISKQLLFNYMSYKQLPVQPHMSKEEIIRNLLQYWKTNEYEINNEPSKYVSHKSDKEIDCGQGVESQQQQPNVQCQQMNSYSSSQSELSQHNIYSSQTKDSSSQYEPNNTSLVPQSRDIVTPPTCNQVHLSNNSSLDIVCLDIDIDQLSFEFIKWFNDKFNSCTYTNGYPFDSNMFFHNANAELKIMQSSSRGETVDNSVQVESGEQIGAALVELQKTYNLYFNPNYESLKVTRNSYGNIVIGVCGSLHSNNQLMGVYEQLFQLFNDPHCQLNEKPVWKIQKMLLNLKFTNSYQAVEYESSQNRELVIDAMHSDATCCL